jgi:hypothetical protein
MLQDGSTISYASKTLTKTKAQYSVMEKVMLPVVFTLDKWQEYTYNRQVKDSSDHKLLQSISKKRLDKAGKRLQGMLVCALTY